MGFHSRAVLSGIVVLQLSGCGDSGGNTPETLSPNVNDSDAASDTESPASSIDTPTEVVESADPLEPEDPDPVSETIEDSGDQSVVAQPTTPATSPNFLLIISDDQGLDASPQYSFSQDLPRTPVLNAFSIATTWLFSNRAFA